MLWNFYAVWVWRYEFSLLSTSKALSLALQWYNNPLVPCHHPRSFWPSTGLKGFRILSCCVPSHVHPWSSAKGEHAWQRSGCRKENIFHFQKTSRTSKWIEKLCLWDMQRFWWSYSAIPLWQLRLDIGKHMCRRVVAVHDPTGSV